MRVSFRRLDAPFPGPLACFLIIGFELGGPHGGEAGIRVAGLDGAVGGDVHAGVGVVGVFFRRVAEVFEVLVHPPLMAGQTGYDRGGRFASRFAVPACAFGIDGREHFLVGFAGPSKRIRKFDLVDFVVVIDEFSSLRDGIAVVC